MLRLTLLLCIGMFATLMIAGEDRGQLRPGLADASARKAAEGAEAPAASEAASLVAAVPESVAPPAPEVEPEPVVARAEPEPYVEPEREVVAVLEDPVFSLSAIGNEPVPEAPAPLPAVEPERVAGGGTIWYVNASSVNVRAEPSTGADIVGKLAQGEATLMVQAVDADWARIVIQGDGLEGYVALRYLSAEAP